MKLTLKIGLATVLWTAAVACAIAFSIHHDETVLIWGILTSAAAAVVSAMVAGDFIAQAAAHYIVGKITAEREATIDRAIGSIREIAQAREDRTVSRVQSANEALTRRVAVQVAEAITGDQPSRIH